METQSAIPPTESPILSPAPTRPRWWLWLLAGFLGVVGGWFIWSRLQQDPTPVAIAAQATAVETETARSAPVREFSEFVGALEAQERVMLRPEVEGRITQVLVSAGDRVAAGTPIIQLSPERPQAIVSSAVADIEVARAARSAAQAEILEAEAERDSAIAERELQNSEYTRTQSLVAAGALAEQSLDQVGRNQDVAIAALTAAERRIQTARANLAEANAALQRAESNAAVASEDLSDYQVVAPIDGVVGDLPVEVGDYIRAGEMITALTSNQAMDLRLSIPVERSNELRPGLPVELRTQASGAPLVTGRISFVAERVEAGAQSILAKASFPNPNGQLRDEQFVRANVVWTETPGVMVPTTAISRVGGQSFAFVMEPSPETDSEFVAVQRPVQLGIIENNRYHVISGIDTGETIITAGILRLADGAPVVPDDAVTPN
ncbi:rnd family efflux transporter mfp subunit [Leptolyngbya sp. Heron Island J]|uniref:efflux RND transporter periplasmic adaptor subunit n=1 Tax=Leptolyngbya sp. Heron Island J TaxID=1385935 RepID=UPI0003B93C5D|nr:efflux RND transporter periplasmic adaptor subunit [Leptolyngbya sp. Heron Island J]ESA38642.1 rnd family efflux transporter mfp subunit [Leptolyngbya sp. Heron Island J]